MLYILYYIYQMNDLKIKKKKDNKKIYKHILKERNY